MTNNNDTKTNNQETWDELKGIFPWLGAAFALSGVFALYAHTTEPDFTIVETTPERTHVQYTYPSKYPSPVSLETHALRTFGKNAIGEEIVLEENRPGGDRLTLKRLTQKGGLSECAEFEIQENQTPPAKRTICIGRYPSGF